MSIEVNNLLKVYGTQKAVNNISFRIEKGEIVGFLGPNGAGKSTTLKIITGYLEATSGEVKVCGISVQQNALAVKKKIGYLAELNALYYDLYVKEYLQFIASLHQISNKKDAVNHVIGTTGLDREQNKKIGQLSKGYKQRVGLAAALIHNPEVLILDEPTSGLDPNQLIEIREVIKKQGANKTVLFSSHILQEVEMLCDRVLIINQGTLVADQTISALQQKTAQQQVISIIFEQNIAIPLLEAIPDVTKVMQYNNTYLLTCTNESSVKKQLLRIALEQNTTIVSLQSEKQSLEDAFRQLTKT